MRAYSSRKENKYSYAMNQEFNEAMSSSLTKKNQMKPIAQAYSMKRKSSVHEAVHHIISDFWLQKTFSVLVFDNKNILEKRFRVCLNESKIKHLPENLTDTFRKTWFIGMQTNHI